MPRRLLSAAAAGALLLGLAACGDETDGPVTTPPPSIDVAGPSDGGGDTEPSDGGGGDETPEPTADAPDIPPPDPADFAGMDEHTPEGAEQAFRYYIAMSMWAHQTGNRGPLSDLESKDCSGCSFLNEDIAKINETGMYWSKFEIKDTGTAIHDSNNFEHEIGYVFTLTGHTRPNESFTDELEVDSIEYAAIGGMEWSGDHWVTGGMKVEWGEDVYSE